MHARLLAAAVLFVSALPLEALAQDGRVKTVVLGMAARRGVDEGLALAMSDVVQGAISNDKTRLVLGREDIRRVLSFEQERAALGCDDASCLSEIASALDVDRMITGSIDKVGTSYFVVISEIDARSVEPLARVQKRLPLNEDNLIRGVEEMARELTAQASSAPVRSDGTTGSIMVSANPAGAKILVAGEDKGVTPTRVEGLAPGTHELTLEARGFAPVKLQVPVFKDKVTEVGGSVGGVGQASPEDVKAYADQMFWHNILAWTKVGVGSPCSLIGCCSTSIGAVLILPPGPDIPSGLGNLICGGLILGTGVGLLTWGVLDFINPPEDPLTAGSGKHKLTVAPPPGEGEIQQVELDAVTVDEMAH
jgi:hypothetical protein